MSHVRLSGEWVLTVLVEARDRALVAAGSGDLRRKAAAEKRVAHLEQSILEMEMSLARLDAALRG